MQIGRSRLKPDDEARLVSLVPDLSIPIEDEDAVLDALMDQVREARFVLLGEASHGTSEYYTWRARISQRLILEKNFSFIAVEGDWPDCYQVNRYIKGYPGAGDSAWEALQAFQRWPIWMWANWEVAALVEWLRQVNGSLSNPVGFYGLDVYSLWESMSSIVNYLEKTDPDTARLARQAYLCFEPYGEDEQAYAWSTRLVPEDCEDEVVDLLLEMRRKGGRFDSDPESAFSAEQNALVMVNAERYYRAMVRTDQYSWNVRDTHMSDTLDRLVDHHGPGSKAIVWAHNTHIGDARATDMAAAGMVNLGQLVRERHSDEGVVLAGFGSQHGSVIAGREWGSPMERMPVPDARPGSWEAILHRAGKRDCLLRFGRQITPPEFFTPRSHRAIGVVYNPERERLGNYVPSVLPSRYDAFLFFDETEALHPFHLEPAGEARPPATYPWGL